MTDASETTKGLRIGIDVRPAQLQSAGRGIGRAIFDIADSLARFAPENLYFLMVLPEEPVPERFAILPDCCRVVPLPTHQLGHLPFIRQRYRWDKLPPIWAFKCDRNRRINARNVSELARRERLDILHFTSLFESTFFVDGEYPCATVQTFHDAIPLAMPDAYLAHWSYQIRVVYRREAAALSKGDALLAAVSESARGDAVALMAVPEERTRVVYNAVSPSFRRVCDTARIRACRQTHRIGDRPFVLFCSGGGPNKNRDGAVRSFARFAQTHPGAQDFVFVIAGPSGDDEDTLRQIATAVGLPQERLILTGFVSDDDLVTLYSTAFALLTPSYYEGFGLPAAQALQIGLPVVASNASSLPEVVGDAGLLVLPDDMDGFAAALGRLLDDPPLRETLIERGKAHVARHFTPERQAESLLAVYREAIARRASSETGA